MLCIRCREKIDDIAVFCQFCGKKQETGEKKQNARTRGNGTGTVFKLPSGKWRAEVTLGFELDGDRLRRKRTTKSGFKTKKEALDYLYLLKNTGEKSKSITISEAYKGIQPKIEKLSDKRVRCYDGAYKHLGSIGHKKMSDLSISDLQNIVSGVKGGFYSKRYVKDLLSKMYKYTFADGKVDRDLSPFIELPVNEPVKEKEIFTNDEISKLWASWNSGNDFSGYILIIIYCALRTGELRSIRCKDIDFNKHIMVGGIKNNRGKYSPIYMVEEIEPVIKYFVSKSPDGVLYEGYDVKFYREWRELKTVLEFRNELDPYSGRHACATILTNAGLPEAVIMAIMRHEKYDTTLGYTHVDVSGTLSLMQTAIRSGVGSEFGNKRICIE